MAQILPALPVETAVLRAEAAVLDQPRPPRIGEAAADPTTGRRGFPSMPTGPVRLVVLVLLALAIVLVIALPWSYDVDSWLALTAGRDIWTSGVPHREVLTVMSQGSDWVDQQWLSQLVSYAIYRIGGLGLLGLVNVALMMTGISIVVAAGWRRGVRLPVMLLMLLLGLWQLMPFREVRTQAFAVPLIATILVLLSNDSRTPSRRVYWCLPLLVVLANLHGTASLCAGLVALRGVTLGWERRECLRGAHSRALGTRWRAMRRPLALVLGAPATLILTPYGLQGFSYYRHTLGNSALKHAVTEWQPITSHWDLALPFFVLAGLAIWSFGRRPTKTTLWERVTLLVLALASIDVLRNDLLFGMSALLIVPASLDAALPVRRSPGRFRDRVNGILVLAAAVIAGLLCVGTLLRPTRAFEEKTQRPGVLLAVDSAVAADPGLKILSDVRYSDWLLWRSPRLAGHVASDARWELLTTAQTDSLQHLFSAAGTSWKDGSRGYRLLVLDRVSSPDAARGFLEEPGRRILYQDSERLVILRTPAAAR